MLLLLLLVLLPTFAVSLASQPLVDMTLGKRVDASKLTRETFQKLYDGKVPCVLYNVYDKLNADAWSQKMMTTLKDEVIEYDSRQNMSGDLESYECTFSEFISALGDNSDHEESMYLMNEDILRSSEEALDLADQLALPEALFERDLFASFPPRVQPRSALIIGGEGARSFLHADPMEWTGVNYLLEGQKIWTFLPPSVPMNFLKARRNAPDAWDQGRYNISAGWVSDIDLFKYKVPLATKGDKNGGNGVLSSVWNKAKAGAGEERAFCDFLSGEKSIDETPWPSSHEVDKCIQIVQKEGELVLIPPRWWHQVYHARPSIAVASQYCNSVNKLSVFLHILTWCNGGGGKIVLPNELDQLSEEEQVLFVIRQGLMLREGEDKGDKLFEELLLEKEEDGEEEE